jgi:hypothetical protein
MQELGSPLAQLLAFSLLGVVLVLSWFLDKKYKANTSLPFIFPVDGDTYLTTLESRRRSAKVWVRLWWAGALTQVFFISIAGYLIFSVYGTISFLVLFGSFKLASGVLFFRRPNVDTLGAFEHLLETTAAIIPLTEMRLKREIERCIRDGLLRQEDYERLLLHLGGRSDAIGTAARQLADESIAPQ